MFPIIPLHYWESNSCFITNNKSDKDRFYALEQSKIPATYVGISQTDKEVDEKILSENFKLAVYATPEKFFNDTRSLSYLSDTSLCKYKLDWLQ